MCRFRQRENWRDYCIACQFGWIGGCGKDVAIRYGARLGPRALERPKRMGAG